jgi:hypothetical protein
LVDNLDFAGAMGTWVAVGFAVVALVRIVGPFLVWRETTSGRYKAITAVRDVDNVFISKGFLISPNIRPCRTVRVLKMDDSNIAKTPEEAWRLNCIENTRFHCGWVKLCQLIKAYNVPGDVENNQTLLPVHRL